MELPIEKEKNFFTEKVPKEAQPRRNFKTFQEVAIKILGKLSKLSSLVPEEPS